MDHQQIHKLPLQLTGIHRSTVRTQRNSNIANESFSQHLQKATQQHTDLKISKHAGMRMNERNITIQSHVWQQIGAKVDEAKQKGVNDSLILLKNAALIVSAKNRTVVTVMDRQEAGEQIFTNIDGTIILDEK